MTMSWIRTSTITCLLSAVSAVAFAQVAQGKPGTQGTPASARPAPRLTGFSVALVEGDVRGASAQEGLSAAAAKALADLKDFLPYKTYRLLDMQWTLGSGKMTSRLRGANGEEYDLVLVTQHGTTVVHGALGVASSRLTLSDLTSSGLTSDGRDVAVATFQLSEVGATTSSDPKGARSGVAAVPASPSEAAQAFVHLANARRPLIDTSFRMDVGETVVVGTSRLQGDKALIVLLTAVGR